MAALRAGLPARFDGGVFVGDSAVVDNLSCVAALPVAFGRSGSGGPVVSSEPGQHVGPGFSWAFPVRVPAAGHGPRD